MLTKEQKEHLQNAIVELECILNDTESPDVLKIVMDDVRYVVGVESPELTAAYSVWITNGDIDLSKRFIEEAIYELRPLLSLD